MSRRLELVLIAVDESPASDIAVEQGLALAAGEGASVVFAHVVSIAGEQLVPQGDKPDRVPEAAETDVLRAAGVKARAVGIPYTTELLIGYPRSRSRCSRRTSTSTSSSSVPAICPASSGSSSAARPARSSVSRRGRC